MKEMIRIFSHPSVITGLGIVTMVLTGILLAYSVVTNRKVVDFLTDIGGKILNPIKAFKKRTGGVSGEHK